MSKIVEKIRKIKKNINKAFPNLFTEFSVILTIAALLCVSISMIGTATHNQESSILDLIQDVESILPKEEVTESTTETTVPYVVEFEVAEPTGTPQVMTQTIEYPQSRMCFIGDGRISDIFNTVLTDAKIISMPDGNLTWLVNEAFNDFDSIKDSVDICVIALGVNDINAANDYVNTLNAFAERYPDKIMVYVNVGPVSDINQIGITNTQIEEFNEIMKNSLSNKWHVLDQYSHVVENGFETEDGIFYSIDNSVSLFTWLVDSVSKWEIEIDY